MFFLCTMLQQLCFSSIVTSYLSITKFAITIILILTLTAPLAKLLPIFVSKHKPKFRKFGLSMWHCYWIKLWHQLTNHRPPQKSSNYKIQRHEELKSRNWKFQLLTCMRGNVECPFRTITLRVRFGKKKRGKKGLGTRRGGEKTTHHTEVPTPSQCPNPWLH